MGQIALPEPDLTAASSTVTPSGLPSLTPEPPKAPTPGRHGRDLTLSPRFWVATAFVVVILLIAFVGPLLYPYGATVKVGGLYDPPSAQHLLGTDNFGYDVLSILMAGTRASLGVGLIAGVIATALGVLIGVVAGYVGGWTEEALMGVTNVVISIPAIIILILLSVSMRNSSVTFLQGSGGIALVIGITSWPWTARSVRAQASSVSTREHIDIAKLSGARLGSILLHDVLPYIASYVVMAFVLQVASAILAESSLAMLGLGASGSHSLGMQLHWALAFQAVASGAWWAFLPPTLMLTFISFGFLLLQSSMDEVFNPRLRRGSKRAIRRAAASRANAARQRAEEDAQ